MNTVIMILSAISALLALQMLWAKNPITSALSLLGVLLMTAGIYGLIGEHLVATIQLVVYAGAIMVLFIFSIMLLNLKNDSQDFKQNPIKFLMVVVAGMCVFVLLAYGIIHHFISGNAVTQLGIFSPERITQLGGNSKVLAHALFSQFYVSFEVISLALLIAIVGAVVLAKRKFD